MVYCKHFRLERMPFDNTPDPAFFFKTPEHEEALAALCYGVTQRRGMTLVTGAPGSGKTMLGRMLVETLHADPNTVTITHPPEDGRDLLQTICRGFGVRFLAAHSSGELIERLHATLSVGYHDSAPRLIVLDEAQNLSMDVLDHVCMLGNLETTTAKLLQIVMLGQPEVLTSLCDPRLEQLRQRLFCVRQISPLDEEQAGQYMRHRLECAGAEEVNLFDEEAIALIFKRSGGVPRIINQFADNAMLAAFGASKHIIDGQIVTDVVREMMNLQVPHAITPPVDGPQVDGSHVHRVAPVAPFAPMAPAAHVAGVYGDGANELRAQMVHLVQTGSEIAGRLTEINQTTVVKADEFAALLARAEAITSRLENACKATDRVVAESASPIIRLTALMNESKLAAEQFEVAASSTKTNPPPSVALPDERLTARVSRLNASLSRVDQQVRSLGLPRRNGGEPAPREKSARTRLPVVAAKKLTGVGSVRAALEATNRHIRESLERLAKQRAARPAEDTTIRPPADAVLKNLANRQQRVRQRSAKREPAS